MMLYQKQPEQESTSTTSVFDRRRNKYRTQIRKTYLKKHFNEIRTKMMDDLKSQSFIDILKCLDSKFNLEEFNSLISAIEGHCENYDFNIKMAQEKMQQILVNVILNNCQNIKTKENRRLISVLSYLTYYSTGSIVRLISRFDFIEHLKKTLQILDMKFEENVSYFKQIIILLMNITSALKRDFNTYIAQSDICYSIFRQISSTKQFISESPSSYNKSVHEAREYILKMLRNVFNNLNDEGTYSSKLAAQILQDTYYINEHQARTFILLSEGMSNQKFWSSLLQKEVNFNFTSILTDSMLDLQERCLKKQFLNDKESKLTDKEIENFNGMLQFLNSLYIQGQQQEISWNRMIQSSLNGFMLADFLFEALRRKNDEHISTAFTIYINLSNTIDVTADQLIIVRPAFEQLQFLKIILDLKIMGNSKYGKLCLTVLKNLLQKDEKFVQTLVQMKVIDILVEIISSSGQLMDLMIKSLELCIQLIMADSKMSKDKKVYQLMMEKGFTKLLQDYQETANRDLVVQVDMLLELFAQEKEAQ